MIGHTSAEDLARVTGSTSATVTVVTDPPTWHPDRDTAGNRNPSGCGMVLGPRSTFWFGEGYEVLNNGCTLERAHEMWPDVVESSSTVPVTIETPEDRRIKI